MDPQTVRNIQVFASFDYNVDSMLRIQMIGMMHVNIDTPNGAAMTYVDGLLNFEQDEPILIDSILRTIYNYDPITAEQYQKYSMPKIADFYASRKGKLYFLTLIRASKL